MGWAPSSRSSISSRVPIGWGFRCRPTVVLTGVEDWDVVLVNNSERRSVSGAFVTVTFHQDADGVDAAELLGKLVQAGADDEGPPAAAGLDEVPGGEGFQGLVDGGAGQSGGAGEVEAALGPSAGVFEGFVDERGGMAEFAERRAQCVQFPGLPRDPRGRTAVSSGIRRV
jgi:hypothetical protein